MTHYFTHISFVSYPACRRFCVFALAQSQHINDSAQAIDTQRHERNYEKKKIICTHTRRMHTTKNPYGSLIQTISPKYPIIIIFITSKIECIMFRVAQQQQTGGRDDSNGSNKNDIRDYSVEYVPIGDDRSEHTLRYQYLLLLRITNNN